MRPIERLKQDARYTAGNQGHRLGRFITEEPHQLATAYCSSCGACVQVDTRPLPNRIDIDGDAATMRCPV